MELPRVFVSRVVDFDMLNQLNGMATVIHSDVDGAMPRAALLEAVRNADALLCVPTERVDADLLAAAPRLRVAANCAVGYDNIDIAACTARSVWATNTPGVLTETTADLAFALMLAAARRLGEARDAALAGEWREFYFRKWLGVDVNGATLCIAGMGRIGAAIARRARGFGMRILYHNRVIDAAAEAETGARWVGKDELIRNADFLMLTLPLNAATRGFIGATEFALMKPNAVLINIARGPIVDTEALSAALSARRIFAAALDVTDPEPLPPGHTLYGLDNCLIAPHIGSATVRTRKQMFQTAILNVMAALRGDIPPNCLNPEARA